MGCIIDKTHVLTAAHCWTAVKHEYEWPAVFTLDRWYRCDVAFYNEEADILLLRLIELVRQFPTSLNLKSEVATLAASKNGGFEAG